MLNFKSVREGIEERRKYFLSVLKHNKDMDRIRMMLESDGRFCEDVNFQHTGKRFVKSFKINNDLIERIRDAKSESGRIEKQDCRPSRAASE